MTGISEEFMWTWKWKFRLRENLGIPIVVEFCFVKLITEPCSIVVLLTTYNPLHLAVQCKILSGPELVVVQFGNLLSNLSTLLIEGHDWHLSGTPFQWVSSFLWKRISKFKYHIRWQTQGNWSCDGRPALGQSTVGLPQPAELARLLPDMSLSQWKAILWRILYAEQTVAWWRGGFGVEEK
jgi:hypothetical protein